MDWKVRRTDVAVMFLSQVGNSHSAMLCRIFLTLKEGQSSFEGQYSKTGYIPYMHHQNSWFVYFYPNFFAVYIVERLVLQTIYVLNKEILQFLGQKSTVCITFTPLFTAVYIVDNLCTKQRNSSILGSKIHGL